MSAQLIQCACGCGKLIDPVGVNGRLRKYEYRHNFNRNSFRTRNTDFMGQRFHRLLVIGYMPPDEAATVLPDRPRCGYWLCRCDCGTEKYIASVNMKATKSCGCLNSEQARLNAAKGGEAVKIKDRVEFLLTRVIKGYKVNAKTRGFSWNLSRDKVRELILADCEYCGSGPTNTWRTTNRQGETEELHYNGIDRIDSARGYEDGNVVPCCKLCNTGKMNLTLPEFQDWIRRVHARLSV